LCKPLGYGAARPRLYASEEAHSSVDKAAIKHGVVDEDIIHAIDNHHRIWAQDDGVTMFIGPSRRGLVLEVGVISWFGGVEAVAHAMPAREKYLR
jgi:hypothetical protein